MSSPRAIPEETSTAAILVIGNEVLSGKITDLNSPFLLKELYSLGVRVERVMVVPDELDVIASQVRQFSHTYDHVFTSGGVGPTHDDVTLPAIAAAFDEPLVEHPELAALVAKHCRGEVTEAAMRMALVPRSSTLIWEPDLKFPSLLVRNVHVFPGVPEHLRGRFAAIRERFRNHPYHLVQIFSLESEPALAARLEQTLQAFPGIQIGSYPRFDTSEYKVLVTLESKDLALLCGARDDLLERLDPGSTVRIEGP